MLLYCSYQPLYPIISTDKLPKNRTFSNVIFLKRIYVYIPLSLAVVVVAEHGSCILFMYMAKSILSLWILKDVCIHGISGFIHT